MFSVSKQIWKIMRGRLVAIMSIIGVLLFLCTVFFVWNTHVENISDQVREKLGIYLYLDDDSETEALVTAKALEMVQEFDAIGVSAQFYTKEDAFSVLEKKLPDVTADLEKYGISNPLPPTLYIVFKDEQERVKIKDIVLTNQDVIQNAQDIDSPWFSFAEQERRVVDVLNVVNVTSLSIIFLLTFLGAIVIGLILFLMESLYDRFYTDVEVKVLSWLPYLHISAPFLLVWLLVFLWWFMIHVWLLTLVFRALSPYITRLFQSDPFVVIFPANMYTYEWILLIWWSLLCLLAGTLLLRRRMTKMKG